MASRCRDAAIAGLWIEVFDTRDHFIGQAVYFDWHDRPLPDVGERINLSVPTLRHTATQDIAGRVAAREFDLQQDDSGQPIVWVRLSVRRENSRAMSTPPRASVSFSPN